MAAAKASEAVETVEEADIPAPAHLGDYEPERRGYIDRMLRPQRGMVEGRWAGKAHFKCPRCGAETFDASEAKRHRC